MAGLILMIRAAGFNGIAAIILEEDMLMILDKSSDGKRFADTMRLFKKIVIRMILTAEGSSGRLFCIGHMTAGRFENVFAVIY